MKHYYTLLLVFFFSSINAQQETGNNFLVLAADGRMELTQAGASHFAQLALDCIHKEYPNKLNQVLHDSTQLNEPHELHPAFYGCFDWHSSVHGHWMLVRLLKQFPTMPEAFEIRQKLDKNLTQENIQQEVAYLAQANRSWERMYGWAWLLKLSEELYTWPDYDGQLWYQNLLPLTEAIILRYETFLPIQRYPIRTGMHENTAFGLSFAWDYAKTTGAHEFRALIEERARHYFLLDQDCPTDWEPSGEDFLSGCMMEADLMRRVLTKREFNSWFKYFIPKNKLLAVAIPANVSDRSDPKIVHLDGLNLSRSWCMYGVIPKIRNKKYKRVMLHAAQEHLLLTIPNIASEHYEGAHWLASFAVFALSAELPQELEQKP